MQNIVFNLKLNSKDFTTSVKGAGDALDGAKEKVKGVGDEAQKAGGKIKETTKEVQGLGQGLSKLAGLVGVAFSVGAVINFAKEVSRVSAEMEGLGIRMKGIHGDSEVANRAMDRLRVMANELGLDLKSLTSNYIDFVSAAKATGMEVAKAEKIFKNMSVALTGVGATGERAQRAFVALTQMIGKGCHAPGTLIRLYDGTNKLVEDIKVGDVLISPDGNPRVVEVTINGREEMFEIQTDIGISFVVNRSHKMRVYINGEKQTIVLGDFIQSSTSGKICHESGAVGFVIKSVGEGDFYGFQISGDHLYLDSNGFEHHNSIQAEEFKGQLGEAIPQAMGWMMQATGKTANELMKMMEQGQLTVDVLEKFSEVGFNAVAGEMAEKADSMTANFNRLGNATMAFLLEVGKSAPIQATTKALTALLEAITKGVKVLNEGLMSVYLEEKRLEQQIIATNAVQKISNKLTEDGLSNQQQDVQFKRLRADGMKEEVRLRKELLQTERRIDELNSEKSRKGALDKEQRFELKRLKERAVALKEGVQFQSVMNDELRVKIDTLKEGSVAIAENTQKTKDQIAQERAYLQLQKEIEAMRRRAQLAEKTDVGKLKLKTEFEVQDLQSNPAFLALSEKEQTAILNEIDRQTNEQVQKLIESKNKGLEKLGTHPSLTDATFDEEGLRAQQKAELDATVQAGLEDIQATKDLEEQKKAMRIEMAMQTFDLLSALNARYSQGQVEQLNKQLQQGVISQEAYEAQMRKIKRRQAVIDKAGALFQIGLSTAINVAKNPPPSPLGILAIAAGALQAATVIAAPIPYNKGTKRVPFARGAVRGKDSVHAILTPNERVVPESVNMQPGYSALMDLAQDRKISDSEAGFIADLATSGYRANNQAQTASIDYDLLGRSIAKYFPGTDVKIDKNGIAVISERHAKEHRRLTSKL